MAIIVSDAALTSLSAMVAVTVAEAVAHRREHDVDDVAVRGVGAVPSAGTDTMSPTAIRIVLVTV